MEEELIIKILKDGDRVCALHGDNLQVGLAGFGDNIPEALMTLAECWERERGKEKI